MSFETLLSFTRVSHQAPITLMEAHPHSFSYLTAVHGEIHHEELLVKQIFMYHNATYWELLQVWGLAQCQLDAMANFWFAISCVFMYSRLRKCCGAEDSQKSKKVLTWR